ncbi:MAG: alpha-glucan family phosphorylase [Bacteroidales bacterium]|jgi:phosphorylase/glycogen(starch) synthase|nr:alpha-glucan family phosphorylase [Bacteroidales bacterium]
MSKNIIKPQYVFETSWEVCNKVGGIYTVVSTKANALMQHCDNLILIGPETWHDSNEHPEFEEDSSIFSDWHRQAASEGLIIRIGKWKIPCCPTVILVNFTNYINDKDKILFQFWESFKLDSLSGQWDYIEPVLFGYAAAKIIESFVNYNTNSQDKIIAQFHEWMTGSGILYLNKYMPNIATVFTTHATATGRSIAGNGKCLYKNLLNLNGDVVAKDFNLVSKQSIEKLSAKTADVFTTVSDITAVECKQFLDKTVDIITPNGFEDDFVPNEKELIEKKLFSQKILINVTEKLLGIKFEKKPFIIATSGRYEFTNKGYDCFIDALGELNKSKDLQKEILAFLLVPANNYGAKIGLQNRLNNSGEDIDIFDNHLTHNLHNSESDPIIKRIYENKLFNKVDDKVKIIFVPSYLNGNDGIFNLKYYDLLPGIDLTAFVSYYEPWGYTPLESIAFGIPTITTSLAGFGKWIQKYIDKNNKSVLVIERNDDNYSQVVEKTTKLIKNQLAISDSELIKINKETRLISKSFLWDSFINSYLEAYSIAIEKASQNSNVVQNKQYLKNISEENYTDVNLPNWRKFEIQTILPDKFKGLADLSLNLWWSTNYKAHEMFEYMDVQLWIKKKRNPVVFLDEIKYSRLKELEKDEIFITLYENVYSEFKNYLSETVKENSPKIAYFSMEYGFNDNLKIYSGGLGILAGDYLKGASDNNVDLVGVGLLYKYGYFKQKISLLGEQHAEYIPQDFGKMPLLPVRNQDGSQMKISVYFPGRNIFAKICCVVVGRVKLYLLDTNVDENQESDRLITSQLYGGDSENRFKQEMILGVGGIRALNELNIIPDIYHCNEGHAAFIGLERLRLLINTFNLKFEDAKEIVRTSTLFTTHTPVPAGHDAFDENLIRAYMSHYPDRLGISWEDLMKLGRQNSNDKFSMSFLAANLSQEINGVSMVHGDVSKEMFANLWKGYFPEENHIGYVTNGVHYKTWTAKEWKHLHEKTFGQDYLKDLSNIKYWEKIQTVENSVIWEIRQNQRKKLIDFVKYRLQENSVNQYDDPKSLVKVLNSLDQNTLTIGFARRFATYKRGDLLFRNLERLSEILNNKNMPVQIVFAGKAHPNDKAGQDLIKKIVQISKKNEFLGKIVFIEDYDITLAEKLVQGVDVWLNTPTRPLEASGTSGMKAVMNGALHFSVLDGWWVEGYQKNAGWALPQKCVYENNESQNELDAQMIYNIIETEIAPTFYNRDEKDIPNEWIAFVKNSINFIVPKFTTKRMIDDYFDKYYNNLFRRTQKLIENDFNLALTITEWKKFVANNWDSLKIISAKFPDYEKKLLKHNNVFEGEIEIELGNLKSEDIGIDVLISYREQNDSKFSITEKYIAKCISVTNNIATFYVEGTPQHSGIYNYAIRIYAKNKNLPYQHDSGFVKWL